MRRILCLILAIVLLITSMPLAFSDDGLFEPMGGDPIFTRLADPEILPASTGRGVAFSSDGTYMAVAHATTPYVTIYKRSGYIFTKLTNPLTLPTGQGNGIAFSPDGTYLAVAHTTAPNLTIYKRSGDEDRIADYQDASIFVSHFSEEGYLPGESPSDINEDGIIDYIDASIFVRHFSEIY